MVPGVGQQLAVVPQPCFSVWVLRSQHLRHTILRGAVAAHVLFVGPAGRIPPPSAICRFPEIISSSCKFPGFLEAPENVYIFSPLTTRRPRPGDQKRRSSSASGVHGSGRVAYVCFRGGKCLILTGRRRDLGGDKPKRDSHHLSRRNSNLWGCEGQ